MRGFAAKGAKNDPDQVKNIVGALGDLQEGAIQPLLQNAILANVEETNNI